MAATRLITMHLNKGKSIAQCIKDRTDYAQNPDKTDNGLLVSSYECDPKLVEEQFMISKREYLQKTGRRYKSDVIAYQIRQAFKPGEITPEEANRIGYETAMRWTKGKHAFIVATHIDREHIHNHIIYNSTNLNCNKKYRDHFRSGVALQKVSDLICIENGLSVIKPKWRSERIKRTEYPARTSNRDEIRRSIDECLNKKPQNMDEFLKLLSEKGYEIKTGKYISVKSKEQKKFIRFRSLGEGYTEQDIEDLLTSKKGQKVDMLVDIQDIIAKGKGIGYERWAKVYNIKQIAQTLLFLQERDIWDYDELAKRASETYETFNEITQRQKALEARIGEILELKKHIINYSRTKDIYTEYRKSGYSKRYFEAHREEITLHKAAKDAFSKTEGKIPKIKELNHEYEGAIKEKRENYVKYRQAKQDMKEYQIAKYNIDEFMNKTNTKERTKERTKEEHIRSD